MATAGVKRTLCESQLQDTMRKNDEDVPQQTLRPDVDLPDSTIATGVMEPDAQHDETEGMDEEAKQGEKRQATTTPDELWMEEVDLLKRHEGPPYLDEYTGKVLDTAEVLAGMKAELESIQS